jgi:hypothetical protein
MESAFAWAMAGAASAHQAATASREQNSQQRAVRTRRTSADPQQAQQGATAAAAAAPAALDSLSRLQQLADASPQVAQLQRLQALADAHYAPVSQLAGIPEEEGLVQGQFATAELQPQLQQAPRAINTGLPDQLKSGIEALSGLSMDPVRVHYNSAQPEQLNALAYAQGSDIHLAPGQERHLPHEAWHVVQQAQGRVRPTMQMKEGVQVNDNAWLEREADVMGAKALAPAVHLTGGPEEEELHSASANVPNRLAASDFVQRVRGGIEFTEDAPTNLFAYPNTVGNVPRHNTFIIGAANISSFRVAAGTPQNADLGNPTNRDLDVLASTPNVELTNDVRSAEWIITRHMADVPAATMINNLRADVGNMFTARDALKNAVEGVQDGHAGEVAIVPGVVANINAAPRAFIYKPGPKKGKAQITAQYSNQDTIRRINKLNVSKYLTGTKVAEGEDTARISGTTSRALLQADIAGTTSFSTAEVLLTELRGTSLAIPLTVGGGNRLTQQQVGLVKLMVLNDALANTMVRYNANVGQAQDKNIQRFFPKSRRNEYVKAVAQADLDPTEMGLLRAEIQRTRVADAQLLFNAADPGALRVDEAFNALGVNDPNMPGMLDARHRLANPHLGAANLADLLNIKTAVLGVNGASLADWINDVAVAYTDLTPAATQHQFPGGTDRVIKTSRGYTPVAGGRGAIYEMREREIAIDESGWFNIGSRDELNDAIERIFNAAG